MTDVRDTIAGQRTARNDKRLSELVATFHVPGTDAFSRQKTKTSNIDENFEFVLDRENGSVLGLCL